MPTPLRSDTYNKIGMQYSELITVIAFCTLKVRSMKVPHIKKKKANISRSIIWVYVKGNLTPKNKCRYSENEMYSCPLMYNIPYENLQEIYQ